MSKLKKFPKGGVKSKLKDEPLILPSHTARTKRLLYDFENPDNWRATKVNDGWVFRHKSLDDLMKNWKMPEP